MRLSLLLLLISIVLFNGELMFLSSCTDKTYPCPTPISKKVSKKDTTDLMFGGSYTNTIDEKTGLIKKRKNKKLKDRKSPGNLF
jgi:hypothetical protein